MGAATSWDGIWFPEKHVADRLTEFTPVLYVDPPLSPLTARRDPALARSLQAPRLRLVRPGLARLTPVAIPGLHRLRAARVNELLARRAVRRAVGRLTDRVQAVVMAGPADLFGVGERRRLLYATDDYAAGAALMGLPVGSLRRAEARVARRADTVVAVSEALAETWRARGIDPELVPNGCDAPRFAATDEAPWPPDVDLPPPVAGYVGHLSARIDLSLLEAVAARGRSLLLVGPRQGTFELARIEHLLALPNVRWVGPRPFESLPSYLRAVDVGLTPYADSGFNRASFPLKTLEYLAAGRAAVASDLPAVRWLATDLVRVASGPQAFADEVDAALAEVRTPDVVARRRAFAAGHSWEARTARMAELVGVHGPVPVVRPGRR